MSTINATTVQATNVQDTAGANSSTTAQLLSGRAKAWVNFNGDAFTTRGSFNVSSVADRGTGIYTINFDTDFSNANYSSVFGGGYITGATGDNTMVIVSAEAGYTPAADNIKISTHYVNGTESDFPWICASFFGDQ